MAFDSVLSWFIIGGIIAVLYSLRYLVVLDRRMLALEESLQKLLTKMYDDEREILLREKLIEKAVIKSKGKNTSKKYKN